MIAGDIDHPSANERVFAKNAVLSPCPQFRGGGRDVPRHPIFAMQLAPDQPLQVAKGDRLSFAQEHGEDIRQGLAAVDDAFDRVEQIVKM